MYQSSIIPPLRIVFLMWLFFTIELYSHVDLRFLGILPRDIYGLVGILTGPLIHGSAQHLISNTIPILFLGTTIYLFYDRIATRVFLHCYFLTNLLVWIFGRPYYHIGASGLLYALAGFLIFFGLFRRQTITIVISAIVMLLYGGLFYGIFPQDTYISWESHLMGFVVGVGTAFGMSRIKKFNS